MLPPTKEGGDAAINNICGGPFTLAGDDLNAFWYEHQTTDQRGDTVEDWLISRNTSILSNGEPTCVNRATGGRCTPAGEKRNKMG